MATEDDYDLNELPLESYDMDSAETDLRCSTPDPTKYHDPSTQALETGGGGYSIAARLPPRNGLKGTIIPRATAMGGSMGVDPNKKSIVIIDPHYRDPIELDMSRVEESMVKRAMPKSRGDMREVALHTFRRLSRDELQRQKAALVAVQTVDVPKPVEVAKPTPRTQNAISPSARMSGVKMIAEAVPTQTSPVTVPTIRVTFEIDGFGTFETSYHRVELGDETPCLILVYDNRFKGGLKYMPKMSEQPIFVDVESLPFVYKAYSSGIRFTVDDQDMCVLLIEQTADKEV